MTQIRAHAFSEFVVACESGSVDKEGFGDNSVYAFKHESSSQRIVKQPKKIYQ